MDLKCGDRTYYINHSNGTVYYSTSSKTSGSTSIKGLKIQNNVIVDTNTGKPASKILICQKLMAMK